MSESARISPTAYATGYFWYRNGLSHPAFATARGRRLDRAFSVLMAGLKLTSGVSFGDLLLARHRGIDAVLEQAIAEGRVRQVIELAAGLSPRGWRFKQRHGDRIHYVETDLAAMVEAKRKLLRDGGLVRPGHRVEELDVLAESGPASLPGIAATLDPSLGTAVISEGLMSYLDPDTANAVRSRIASELRRFPAGVYLSDAYFRTQHSSRSAAVFRGVLQAFVRGRMYVHFETPEAALEIVRAFGFDSVALHEPAGLPGLEDLKGRRGAERVRVLDARV